MMNGDHTGAIPRVGPSACDVKERPSAAVIVNADDWGRDVATTDRSLDCALRGVISSVSAMVWMEDSERAAELALKHNIDAGLHLNFTLPFSSPQCPSRLIEHQGKLSRFLRSHRFAPALYHPGVAASFEYVVKAQQDEYERLYGAPAHRLDGHHHMHLCTNVILQKLLPAGTIVRRNLTFGRGEKGCFNRFYRRRQDQKLAMHHQLTDFFFDIRPLEPRSRLKEILELGLRCDVEVETHPIRNDEYKFLIDGELTRCAVGVTIARGYTLHSSNQSAAVRSIA
jgi:hypothetical protein